MVNSDQMKLHTVSHSCLFYHWQVCFEETPSELFQAKDSQGNGIGHLVAASGNTEVIKVIYLCNTKVQMIVSGFDYTKQISTKVTRTLSDLSP